MPKIPIWIKYYTTDTKVIKNSIYTNKIQHFLLCGFNLFRMKDFDVENVYCYKPWKVSEKENIKKYAADLPCPRY